MSVFQAFGAMHGHHGDLAAGIAGANERFLNSIDAAEFADRKLELAEGDTVLVKGSRSMAMEKVVKALTGRMSVEPEGQLHDT